MVALQGSLLDQSWYTYVEGAGRTSNHRDISPTATSHVHRTRAFSSRPKPIIGLLCSAMPSSRGVYRRRTARSPHLWPGEAPETSAPALLTYTHLFGPLLRGSVEMLRGVKDGVEGSVAASPIWFAE